MDSGLEVTKGKQQGRGVGVDKGKGVQIYGDRGSLTLGGKYNAVYNILLSCTLETDMILLTNVTNNFN